MNPGFSKGIVGMLTSNDPNPPQIGNLQVNNLISLYYVLWITPVRDRFSSGDIRDRFFGHEAGGSLEYEAVQYSLKIILTLIEIIGGGME